MYNILLYYCNNITYLRRSLFILFLFLGVYGIPKRMGLLKGLNKFDNLYFGINHKSSQELDPQARILLEVVYESIVDAGM